jgi:hypothetical protein
MPIKPKADETEQEFISRCIGEEINAGYEQEQSAAICYSYWRENMQTEDITDVNDDLETEVAQGFVYAKIESEEFATLPTTDCMEKHMSAGYSKEYAKMACSKPKMVPEDSQQGGVAMSEEFARKKFEYSPKGKESMQSFMARCMSDDMVREKKKDRVNRTAFCYSQYQQKYIASIAMGWK